MRDNSKYYNSENQWENRLSVGKDDLLFKLYMSLNKTNMNSLNKASTYEQWCYDSESSQCSKFMWGSLVMRYQYKEWSTDWNTKSQIEYGVIRVWDRGRGWDCRNGTMEGGLPHKSWSQGEDTSIACYTFPNSQGKKGKN